MPATRPQRMRRRLAGAALTLLCLSGCDRAAQVLPQDAQQRPLAEQGPYLACDQAGSRWVCVGAGGRILWAPHAGGPWQRADSPATRLLTAVHFVDERHGWAVGHDGVILHSADGGMHWTVQRADPAADLPLFAVRFSDRERGLAVGAFGLMLRTEDGGRHWQAGEVGQEGLHLYGLAAQGDAWLMVGEQGLLMRSRDHGQSWQALREADGHSLFGIAALHRDRLLVFGLGGWLALSEDGGAHWRKAALPSSLTLHTATVRADRPWLVATDGSLWSLDEAGQAVRSAIRLPAATASLHAAGEDAWLAAGLTGIRLITPEIRR